MLDCFTDATEFLPLRQRSPTAAHHASDRIHDGGAPLPTASLKRRHDAATCCSSNILQEREREFTMAPSADAVVGEFRLRMAQIAE
jgi:hypothetical protein